jgi:hypothetical protein
MLIAQIAIGVTLYFQDGAAGACGVSGACAIAELASATASPTAPRARIVMVLIVMVYLSEDARALAAFPVRGARLPGVANQRGRDDGPQ